MRVSVVVRSRDEAPRLRLVLASLGDEAAEIVVVDDGSADATPDVIAAAARTLPIVAVRHARAEGRSAAANAGARVAGGDLLVFLDGDTLAGPGMVAAHLAAHAGASDRIGRGETWHLRCTRALRDPETGEAWPNEQRRLAALPTGEIERMRVTATQVRDDFAAIERRAAPGIYPGAAPRALYEREMRALTERPDDALLWTAASGSNLSVRRETFLAAGGFDPALDINEHRELALRLCAGGARMVPVTGARTYHMIHRSGWRDPLVETGWEDAFRRRHPRAPLAALKAFWRGMGDADAPDWLETADAA